MSYAMEVYEREKRYQDELRARLDGKCYQLGRARHLIESFLAGNGDQIIKKMAAEWLKENE